MANHTISGTTVSNVVSTITFSTWYPYVEITNSGAVDLWVRTDGTAPTVSGDDCTYVPFQTWKSDILNRGTGSNTVVKIISSGVTTFTVEGQVD